MSRVNTASFIERSIRKHGDMYDYTKSIYVKSIERLIITCRLHGDFLQTPDLHMNAGCGCPECGVLKVEQTNLQRYGVKYPLQSKLIQQKTRDSCLITNGVLYPLQSNSIRDDAKGTRLTKYGNEHYLNSEIGSDHRAQVMQDRYGTLHALQVNEFKEKVVITNQNRYNSDYYQTQHISSEHHIKLNDGIWLYEQHYVNKLSLTEIANLLGVSPGCISFKFKYFNIEVIHHGCSISEKEICDYIKSIYSGVVISNSRLVITPKELDIFLPEKNLAIEYNGIFWHSEGTGLDKNYHLNKTTLCNNESIRLVQIFENEWHLQQDIVKSRLSTILGNNNTLYARKCRVITLTPKIARGFFKSNHMQGYANCAVCYGLELDGEVVAAMSFGVSRFNKQFEYELIRFSNKLYTNVVGGASKLFVHFIKNHNPNSIISYSDKRWNTGGLYLKLGFTYTHCTPPNYYYFDTKNSNMLMSRQRFQKHKLSKILGNFDYTLTEWENMQNNGYNRIWDCGNSVYVYRLKQ